MHTIRRATAIFAGCGLLAAFTILPALAHSRLASADPAPGATVTAAPKQVKITLTEETDPSQSSITVTDASGARVDAGDGKVDTSDPDRKTLVVSLKSGLGNGVYTVHYRTFTPDDQGVIIGVYRFGVNAAVPAGQAKQETESGGEAGEAPAAQTPGKLPNTGEANPLSPTLPLIAGAALLGVGMAIRFRRAVALHRH